MTTPMGRKHPTHDQPQLQFPLEMDVEADYMSALPTECLANIIEFLRPDDRKFASLVSKQMLEVEGQSHRQLTLDAARPDLLASLLSRFDSFTELVIECCRSSTTDIDADDMLNQIGKQCGNRIVELVLSGVHVTCTGIESIAWRFKKLERLTICGRKTTSIGDEEISCIASKCVGLKKLCIKRCPVTDQGIKAFAQGCPDLVEINIDKCKGVTSDVVGWLAARRGSLAVNLDVGDQSGAELDSDCDSDSGDDGGGGADGDGVQENGVDIPSHLVSRQVYDEWPPNFRSRVGGFGGRNPTK